MALAVHGPSLVAALRMQRVPAPCALEHSGEESTRLVRDVPMWTPASATRLHPVEQVARYQCLMLTGEDLIAERDDPCVEAAVEEVLDRVCREEVALAGAESGLVRRDRDRAIRLAGGTGRECFAYRFSLQRLHHRALTRRPGHISERDRSDGQAALGALVLRFQDVNAELVGEELGHAAHDCEHHASRRSREVEVLSETDEPDPGPAQAFERLALNTNVSRPAVQGVHEHHIESTPSGVSEERAQLRPLFDPIGMGADSLVGVDADQREAMLRRVTLDFAPLGVERVPIDLLLGRDPHVADGSGCTWLHCCRLLKITARATDAHSRIMCSTAARSAWSSRSRGFASGPAIADLPGLSESFPDPVGASAPPQAMKADRAPLSLV